ncbi:Uncharacterized protein TCM_043263 [Theobroma cacao]|uniref:Uncharacterized protein n=1 Tax=Theobroma cacao TaxID=3641 RepID=A0A061FNX7_THECC|nr:Uncharacterized protein TCM_043263 [Theobroma cacao]
MMDRIQPYGYVCHGCKVAGRYIEHCPTNDDPNYDFRRVKPTTASSKASASSSSSSFGDNMIPLGFYWPLCKKVMKDAALTKKIVAADILPSMTLRDTINRNLNQSGSRNSDNGGASFSIQDTASKADQKTEIIVPPQHTSEKVKQPTPKGSVPACGKRRATEEGNFGCDGTEKEEEGLHGPKLPTVANLPICWS